MSTNEYLDLETLHISGIIKKPPTVHEVSIRKTTVCSLASITFTHDVKSSQIFLNLDSIGECRVTHDARTCAMTQLTVIGPHCTIIVGSRQRENQNGARCVWMPLKQLCKALCCGVSKGCYLYPRLQSSMRSLRRVERRGSKAEASAWRHMHIAVGGCMPAHVAA